MREEVRWTAWSEDHITKHGVTPSEAEQVLQSRPQYIRSGRNGSLLVSGTTESGRYLLVVVALEDAGTVFVITARDMTAREKTWFRRRVR